MRITAAAAIAPSPPDAKASHEIGLSASPGYCARKQLSSREPAGEGSAEQRFELSLRAAEALTNASESCAWDRCKLAHRRKSRLWSNSFVLSS